MVKFRKRLTKFKITITLPKKFGSKGFITALKSLRFEEALANLIRMANAILQYIIRRYVFSMGRKLDWLQSPVIKYFSHNSV